jgi:threonine dehydrogenase-like Zn-dependent dehydrogenase
VKIAGICATDLEQVKGYYPFCGIPGHEFVGVVESSPSDATWCGRKVVGEINVECGYCRFCKEGLGRHCENRTVLGILNKNGCFGEYLVLPLNNLYPVPDHVPDEAAVFTEPIAAALEILEQVHIKPSDQVLIIGAGRLGQLIARVISFVPCGLSILARYPSQKTLLRNIAVNILEEADIQSGMFDVVIEATGSPIGFEISCRAVRPRGCVVLKSTYASPGPINLSPLVVDEITLLGSRCGPFQPAINLLSEEQLDPTVLISDRYALNNGFQAYQRAAEPGVLKVLLGI